MKRTVGIYLIPTFSVPQCTATVTYHLRRRHFGESHRYRLVEKRVSKMNFFHQTVNCGKTKGKDGWYIPYTEMWCHAMLRCGPLSPPQANEKASPTGAKLGVFCRSQVLFSQYDWLMIRLASFGVRGFGWLESCHMKLRASQASVSRKHRIFQCDFSARRTTHGVESFCRFFRFYVIKTTTSSTSMCQLLTTVTPSIHMRLNWKKKGITPNKHKNISIELYILG